MKTTLVIDDTVMIRLKQEAARTGRTMSELVEVALRRLLEDRGAPKGLAPLTAAAIGAVVLVLGVYYAPAVRSCLEDPAPRDCRRSPQRFTPTSPVPTWP